MSIASAVGILVVGVAFGVEAQTLVYMSFALLSIVLCVGLVQVLYVRDFYFALPLVWGLLGVSRNSYSEVCAACDAMDAVRVFATAAAGIVGTAGAAAAGYQLYRRLVAARRAKAEGKRALLTAAAASPV